MREALGPGGKNLPDSRARAHLSESSRPFEAGDDDTGAGGKRQRSAVNNLEIQATGRQ
jgi:hypothetical protein